MYNMILGFFYQLITCKTLEIALNLTREYTDIGEDKLNISTVGSSSQAMIIKSGRKKKLGNEILILVGSFDGTGISELVGITGKIKQNSGKRIIQG